MLNGYIYHVISIDLVYNRQSELLHVQGTDVHGKEAENRQQCRIYEVISAVSTSEFMLKCPSLREVRGTMLHFRWGEREAELLVISNICSSLHGACGTIDIIGKCIGLDFPLLQFVVRELNADILQLAGDSHI